MTSLADLLRNEIGKASPKDREGRTWGELVVQATILLAMKGNATALKILWHYLSDINPGENDEDGEDLSSFTNDELLSMREMLDVVDGGPEGTTGSGDTEAGAETARE